jgi:hypothetical protein
MPANLCAKRRREAREALARLRKELTSFNEVQQILRRTIKAVDHQPLIGRDDELAEIKALFETAPSRNANRRRQDAPGVAGRCGHDAQT